MGGGTGKKFSIVGMRKKESALWGKGEGTVGVKGY